MFNVAQITATRYAEVPQSFSSIAEAHDFFEHHRCSFFHEFHEIIDSKITLETSNAYADLLQRYASLLEKWSVALDRFEQHRSLLTTKERMGLKILRIHQYKQLILLDHARLGMTDLITWDKYNLVFEEIVSLAASVVDTMDDVESLSSKSSQSSDPSKEGRLKPSFSLDIGIIAPLYDVATLCRDPSIRRRAVNVLRSASRQEGLFNSHVCAVIAEKVIALEETVASGGLDYQKGFASFVTLVSDAKQQQQHHHHIKRCSEVPNTARLSYAYPKFDTVNQKAFLTIGQARGMHMKIPLPAMTAMLDMEK
jgi:hypothetical protein